MFAFQTSFSLYLFNKPNFLKTWVKVNCWHFSVYTITSPLTNGLYITLSTGKEAAGEPDLISGLGEQWRDSASTPKPLRTLDPIRTTFCLTHSVLPQPLYWCSLQNSSKQTSLPEYAHSFVQMHMLFCPWACLHYPRCLSIHAVLCISPRPFVATSFFFS